nr:reverse transcriptase domain-containing protein [Tanacetum cinerariifolium]GEX40143.1 reverse transcriptase domain-containing protein [Tanacetum cinerariifolium]
MPKFSTMFKILLNNKEKLFDLATNPVNENCSAVILKKLPKKLGDPVVDYVVDPWVPLIPGRPFLRTRRDLINVYGEELTLQVDDKAITFKSGNLTPVLNPIVALSSPSLTPFEGGDFIMEEIKACLASKSIPSGIDDTDFDPDGDILLLEKLLNDDPSSPLPPKELNLEELKVVKSSIDDPLELELKDLPSHLEYAFLEGTDKLPVIIAKNLKEDEKVHLIKTKRRPPSLTLMELLPTDACLSAYVMLRARSEGENRASWSDKLDDALLAFRSAFKTPIGCTPYKLVYEKACHLPIELEHKAYWALKHCIYDLTTANDHQKV